MRHNQSKYARLFSPGMYIERQLHSLKRLLDSKNTFTGFVWWNEESIHFCVDIV